MLPQMLLSGLASGLILCLFALGLSLAFGVLHIVNFAHGAFYMLGAYVVWFVFVRFGLPYGVAVLLSVILVGLVGIVCERYLFRNFRGNLRLGMVLAIALMLVMESGMVLLAGAEDQAIPSVFTGSVGLPGASLSVESIVAMAASAALLATVVFFVRWTKPGRALRAFSQDEEGAALQGIDGGRVCSLTMFIGCGLAALAGALMGPILTLNPYMGGQPLMLGFAVIVLGGMGSILGTFVGAIIVGMVQTLTAYALDPQLAYVIVFGMLILVLLIKPTGLFGHA
jgi:branched-chain amino acid transport system permease protein